MQLMKRLLCLLIPAMSLGAGAFAQHYSAINGSNYSGSLGVYNNPSSIVNVPYKWDLTLLGAQLQTISNSFSGPNFPAYLKGGNTYTVNTGNYIRRADADFNLRILNARFSIDRTKAFAFGLNVRGQLQAVTSPVNYTDSIVNTAAFLQSNQFGESLDARLSASTWMEVYGSYGFTLWDQEASRLNVGITVKLLKAMSGAVVQLNNISIDRAQDSLQTFYTIANGDAAYGYSANHGDASDFKFGDMFSNGKAGFAIDLGIEYIIKNQDVKTVFDDEESYYDYDWKIGISLLDLGANHFTYGSESRSVNSLKENISGNVLQEKFQSVQNLTSFNDSLATIVSQMTPLTGNFAIMNPARAVVNADHYLSGNFYVNGELSMNLIPASANKYALHDTRLLTVTPRWERRVLGVYLPVQYTTRGNFWIGAAVKAGPLLLGTHNLLNMFASNKPPGGGGYLALIITPWKSAGRSAGGRNRQYDCPKY
jgi:Family of unknown function (DUF5723)